MFIVNENHYHFQTNEYINKEVLQGCYFYKNRGGVLKHMKKHLNLESHEVCESYFLSRIDEKTTKIINDRCFTFIQENSIEEFIKNYFE